MNLRTPNPLDTTMDADAIMDWDVEWPSQPGTAPDDTITLADWERGRAARAMAINPDLSLDRMPEAWLTNGRKRGRPTRVGASPLPPKQTWKQWRQRQAEREAALCAKEQG